MLQCTCLCIWSLHQQRFLLVLVRYMLLLYYGYFIFVVSTNKFNRGSGRFSVLMYFAQWNFFPCTDLKLKFLCIWSLASAEISSGPCQMYAAPMLWPLYIAGTKFNRGLGRFNVLMYFPQWNFLPCTDLKLKRLGAQDRSCVEVCFSLINYLWALRVWKSWLAKVNLMCLVESLGSSAYVGRTSWWGERNGVPLADDERGTGTWRG